MHPNLQQLSHSSVIQLHKCPRKFQLQKLGDKGIEDDRHTVFGSAFGAACEVMVKGVSKREAYWSAFLNWRGDLLDAGAATVKDGKTFWDCLIALDKLTGILTNNINPRYKVISFNGKLATELGFSLELINGFRYRGFIDAVLLDLQKNELVVLEIKTTKFTKVDEATFKNSGQALGYSLILDAVAESLGMELGSSYRVIYLIYKTTAREYEFMPFDKYHVERANWLKQLIIDTQLVELYEKHEMYPMHGENCYDFFRQCEFFGVCSLGTEKLVGANPAEKVEAEDKYQFKFTLEQLIDSQLKRAEAIV